MPPLIRDGTTADHEPAFHVWREANQARRGGRPPPPSHEARVRNGLAKPDAFLVVAETQGRVVAMALGMQALEDDGLGPPIPGLCHIAMVFVAPTHWGQGLGGQVVDAILERARARGYARTQLWTQKDNARAQRLYEGRGFVKSGRDKLEGDEMIVHYTRPLAI